MIGHLSTILECISTLGGGQTDASNCYTLFNILYLGLLAHITYKHYLIHNNSV